MRRGRDDRSRGHLQRIIATALVVLIGILLVPTSTGAGLGDLPYRLEPGITSSVGYDQRSLATSESLIVWEDRREGTPDLYAYDLDDSREFRPISTEGERRQPDVDGSTIVWVDGANRQERSVRALDLADQEEFELTDQAGRVANPAISDELAAWQLRQDGRWVVRVRKRGADEIETLGSDATNNGRPAVYGDLVAWQTHDGESWNVQIYDMEAGATVYTSDSPDDDEHPVVHEDRLVFTRTAPDGGVPKLMLVNIDEETERTLLQEHYLQRPAIHGDLIVWEDWRSGLPDIYAYDLGHDESYAVARSQQTNIPVVSDRIIAWISGDAPSEHRVQTLDIQERLPTDPADPPAVPTPDRLYVPETEHFVSSGFKAFWQANGGPQVLGFPLTEEFAETNEETGEDVIVQYFERAKLEFHPDAPEDNQVQLALLGYEFRPEQQTEPQEPFESDDSRRYFDETGHGIQGEFKRYWETNGGLGLFGYPLTGEFTEDGRTVQYFERARFEFYPEAEENRVRLGLIGREALQERGWIPPPPVDTTRIFE